MLVHVVCDSGMGGEARASGVVGRMPTGGVEHQPRRGMERLVIGSEAAALSI